MRKERISAAAEAETEITALTEKAEELVNYELEHEYVEIDRGTDYIEYECAICEKHYTEEIESEEPEEHEHEYYEVERVEPTETEDGYVIYECECGDWYEEILPATGTGDEEDFEEGSEEDEENP